MDSDVVVGLITAGSTLTGVVLTGLFMLGAAGRQAAAAKSQADAAWAAGSKQADAAWAAGKSQADAAWLAGMMQAQAQLEVSRTTAHEQALAAERAARRTIYATWLMLTEAARTAQQERNRALGTPQGSAAAQAFAAAMTTARESLGSVRLEGPDAVSAAAVDLLQALTAATAADPYPAALARFLTESQAALHIPPP
ncbi:hypothetical protein [Yinghuangia soli]|uniref:Uncharacterized protein n=1 Tax=Yinghuangia soli TaxID=2908204 RepID=A0AA41Q849_9ACTN|nr:hypothetical protein [Yinghuangia soli]MCF2533002.1 hypothetical protein [Yinghuangia soli]